ATSGAVITSRKVYDGTDGWGEDGFYQMPVFVLTHRPHDVVVKGRTIFTFVTDGIEHTVALAQAAAGKKKVHIMGGASVIQQALQAGLVNTVHLHVAPIVLGAGIGLLDNLTDQIELDAQRWWSRSSLPTCDFASLTTPTPPEQKPATGIE